MRWPKQLLYKCPKIKVPENYKLRNFRKGDEKVYIELMRKAGFEDWQAEHIQKILSNPLSPEGVHFITFVDKPIATASALDRTPEDKRNIEDLIGELGWVACDPAHRGKKLGKVVCAAVVRLFLLHNFRSIFLLTDDWRLAAIKTYLELGFEPVRDTAEMRWRWGKVSDKLAW